MPDRKPTNHQEPPDGLQHTAAEPASTHEVGLFCGPTAPNIPQRGATTTAVLLSHWLQQQKRSWVGSNRSSGLCAT